MKGIKPIGKSENKVRTIQGEILSRILPIIILALFIVSGLGYFTARQIIQKTVGKEREQSLHTAVEIIEKSLWTNKKVSQSLAETVGTYMEAMEVKDFGEYLPNMAMTNKETYGNGVWFEPYAYQKDRELFSPYAAKENGTVKYVENYGTGDGNVFNYLNEKWYTDAKGIGKNVAWSDPYYDDFLKITMVTASTPIFNKDKFVGVTTADIDLAELQKMVVAMQKTSEEHAFLIDKNGAYIAHEDSEKLLKVNVTQDENATIAQLGKQMLEEREGIGHITIEGKKYKTWFTEVPETDWLIAISTSESQLYRSTNFLAGMLSLLSVIIIVALAGMIIYTVRHKVVKPVNELTQVMDKMAQGDFSIEKSGEPKNEIEVVINKSVDGLSEFTKYIAEASSILEKISNGDLDYQLELNYIGEFGKLKTALERIGSSLTDTLTNIAQSAAQVDMGSSQVSSGAQALATSSTQQAATVEELNASIIQIAEKAAGNLENVKIAGEYSEQAAQGIETGNKDMQELTMEMARISNSSNEIANITKTIEDIAFQTNILALNAAIEAARAGVAGKGFAVVAEEVRNLAAKSAEAAQHTAKLIAHSTQTVEDGTKIAERAAQTLREVKQKYELASESMSKIEEASEQQTESIEQIRSGLSQISAVVQGNAATAQENSATSEEMSAQASMLREEIARFKLANRATMTYHKTGSEQRFRMEKMNVEEELSFKGSDGVDKY